MDDVQKMPKKWRIAIFWSAISLVSIDLIRRPITYIIQTWRGDIFYRELQNIWQLNSSGKFHGFPEHFAGVLAALLMAIITISLLVLCIIAIALTHYSINKFYQWAYND